MSAPAAIRPAGAADRPAVKLWTMPLTRSTCLPSHQGQGLGRMLVAFAEAEARRRGHRQLRLYTHELMVESIALYGRLGLAELQRLEEKGYRRVYMGKALGT